MRQVPNLIIWLIYIFLFINREAGIEMTVKVVRGSGHQGGLMPIHAVEEGHLIMHTTEGEVHRVLDTQIEESHMILDLQVMEGTDIPERDNIARVKFGTC